MHLKAPILMVIFLVPPTSAAIADPAAREPLRVADGETVAHTSASVEGGLTVGICAELLRPAETVDGDISVDDESVTRDLSSVNGAVEVGFRATVDGDLASVNGTVKSGVGTVVTGNVETVNGAIELSGTTVGKDLRTVNGRVVLDRRSRVRGDLVVGDSLAGDSLAGDSSARREPLEIELRDGSVIEGDVVVLGEGRQVKVRLAGGAEVMGRLRGAELREE